ncbi:MAG: hypothetical protein O3A36_03995, partial [bacterium]|nr:hypothetical protein [bacterium]
MGKVDRVYAAELTTNEIDEQIVQRQKEIDEVNKKIADLSIKKSETQEEAELIAIAIEQLQARLKKAEREQVNTKASIAKVTITKKQTNDEMQMLEQDIAQKREELTSLIRSLYQYESQSMVRIFFTSDSLSDVLTRREEYKTFQERAVAVVAKMHENEESLREKEKNLEDQAEDLSVLQKILDAQTVDLAEKKTIQGKFLAEKKQKQLVFESLIAEARAAREEIGKQIFTLQSGKVNVSLKTAVDMAKFASSVTGVRGSIIMAVLKVESGIGANVGSGV